MEERIYQLLKDGKTSNLITELRNNPSLLDFVDSRGASLLMICFYFRNKELSDYILSVRAPANIYEAVIAGDFRLTQKFLLADRSQLNKHSKDGFTPLGFAAYFCRSEVAMYLVSEGADVNIPSNNDFKVAPIHSAVSSNSREIVELLLLSGANPNAKQQKDVTPLMGAAHNKNVEIVKLLLTAGASKTDRTTDGKSALDWAKEVDASEVMMLLSSSF
jgi:uncharacterized protein